jgi:thymidylate synthase (FAD)
VSFNNWNSELDMTLNSKGIPKDVSLINYLARELHISPFFHVRLTLELPMDAIDLYDIEDPTYLFRAVWTPSGYRNNQEMMYFRHSYYGWVRLLKEGIIKKPYQGGVYAALDKEAFRLSNHAYNLNSMWKPEFDTAEDYTTDAVPNDHFIDYSMRVTAPIPIMRQMFTHRFLDSNESSRRYISSEPDTYEPTSWRMKPEGSIKQGSVGIHPSSDVITDAYKESVEKAVEVYTGMIDISVAPEQARFVLPQGMESTTIFTGSVVTWERMIVLRTDSHAQLEIQELARQCEEQLLQHTAYSLT